MRLLVLFGLALSNELRSGTFEMQPKWRVATLFLLMRSLPETLLLLS